MEKEGKKACFGYSWADEVEREEKEEELQRVEREEKPNGKPNPFGAARPREVVLEEKGVDWRKLDQNLDHHPSNLRQDKKLKENICLTTPLISRQVQFSQGPRHPDQRKPETEITSPLVPPLRYPPKNIVALMEQIRRGRTDRLNPNQVNTHRPIVAAHYNPNMEHDLRGENIYFQCKRKWNGDRRFGTDDELRGDGRRQVLVDRNYLERTNSGMHYQPIMERTAFEKKFRSEYDIDGNGRRYNPQTHKGRSEYYQPERTAFEKNVKGDETYSWEYSGDGIGRNSSGRLDGSRAQRSDSEVPRNAGGGRGGKKEKLYAVQPGPSNQRRHGKHHAK